MESSRNAPQRSSRPSGIRQNDSGRYEITRGSMVFSFFDKGTELQTIATPVTPGKTVQLRAQADGECSGITCTAEAAVDNGTRRLLAGRTMFHDEGSWNVNLFTVSGDMREQPCGA